MVVEYEKVSSETSFIGLCVCVCVCYVTVVCNVVRLLAGVVRRDTVELHSNQGVHYGFVFVLVEFGQLLS